MALIPSSCCMYMCGPGDGGRGGCDRVSQLHRQNQKPRLRLRGVRVPQSSSDGPEEADPRYTLPVSFCVITSAVSLLLSHRCSPPSPPPELTLGQLLTLSSRGRQISHYSSQVYTAVCLSLTEASPDVIGARVFFKPSIQSILECFLFSCLGVSDCLLLVVR